MSTPRIQLGLLIILGGLTACHSYTAVEPGRVVDYERVRVTIADGGRVDLYHPVVENDSIKGRTEEHTKSPYYTDPIDGYALADVQRIEGVRTDALKSVGVILLTIGGLLAAFTILLVTTADFQ